MHCPLPEQPSVPHEPDGVIHQTVLRHQHVHLFLLEQEACQVGVLEDYVVFMVKKDIVVVDKRAHVYSMLGGEGSSNTSIMNVVQNRDRRVGLIAVGPLG